MLSQTSSDGPSAPLSSPRSQTRSLQVVQIAHETVDTISIVLRDPTGDRIHFKPGQFFPVMVPTPNGVLRRTYSATNAPGEFDGGVRLVVKRRSQNNASAYLNDHLRVGDILQVLSPAGRFVPEPALGPRHLVLTAGGSGITPMMAICRTLLAQEPQTRLSLIYGNHQWTDVIFREELERLRKDHPDRFEIRHVLASPPEGWTGGRGLLTSEVIIEQLRSLPPGDEYFVCGPEPMMEEARKALSQMGIGDSRIRVETFTFPQRHRASPPGGSSVL